jgi:hypothetical protein
MPVGPLLGQADYQGSERAIGGCHLSLETENFLIPGVRLWLRWSYW